MNKQREALLLALEALDSDNPDIMLRASIAIREALAEPEQEPVAKVKVVKAGGNAGIAWHAVSVEPCCSLPLMRDGTLLYAAPQTRKPLTDEEVDKIIAEHVTITDQHLLAAVYMAIREVEQAHGITE